MYHDLDLYGNDTAKGEAEIHYDEDAIQSAFTTWITSKRGDYLNLPADGGILDFSLFKNMNDETIEILTHQLRTSIINEFTPAITLQGLSITPDYQNRMWVMEIKYQNPLTLTSQTIQIFTKDLTKKINQEYENIEYTGLNLRNWVAIVLPDMKGKLLIYDTEKESWRWSKFLLTKFTYSDSYFSEILALINTGS
jgi:hypothetical protein